MLYNPSVFDVNSISEAMAIILTPEGQSTAQRWQNETPWLADYAVKTLELRCKSIVLDYGCGIGRVAKELIAATGCFVIGVDISPSMRALAASYVDSDRFISCAPSALEVLDITFDAAISIWVLQHALDPQEDVNRIHNYLSTGAPVLIVNNKFRAVPSDTGWINDGIDIKELLESQFESSRYSSLPSGLGTPELIRNTWVGTYQAR